MEGTTTVSVCVDADNPERIARAVAVTVTAFDGTAQG